jgi:hypothetical protein
MTRTTLAAILLAIILLLAFMKSRSEKKAHEKFTDASGSMVDASGSMVDASGSMVDASGNTYDSEFISSFSKFLNKIVKNINFKPADETKMSDTLQQDQLNANMEKQMTPMIAQGIDSLRLASSAQDNY